MVCKSRLIFKWVRPCRLSMLLIAKRNMGLVLVTHDTASDKKMCLFIPWKAPCAQKIKKVLGKRL